jgi:hypothetical protein
MPAEWLKLLRAARASRQVAGLPWAQVRASGNLRLAHWPIPGSRLGRPSRGASQAGVVQRRKSAQRGRRSIAAATLTITRLQKTMICARSRPQLVFRSKSTRARQMSDHATANSGSHLPGDAAESQYPETAGPRDAERRSGRRLWQRGRGGDRPRSDVELECGQYDRLRRSSGAAR